VIGQVDPRARRAGQARLGDIVSRSRIAMSQPRIFLRPRSAEEARAGRDPVHRTRRQGPWRSRSSSAISEGEAQRELESLPDLFRPDTPNPWPRRSLPPEKPRKRPSRRSFRGAGWAFESGVYRVTGLDLNKSCRAVRAKGETAVMIAKVTGRPAEKAKLRPATSSSASTPGGRDRRRAHRPHPGQAKGARSRSIRSGQEGHDREVEVAEEERAPCSGPTACRASSNPGRLHRRLPERGQELELRRSPGLRQSLKNVRVKGGLRRI